MQKWMCVAGVLLAGLTLLGCEDDLGDAGDKTCIATYDLDVSVEQRNTPGGFGDGKEEELQGTLVLRYPNAGGKSKGPANGMKVEVLNLFFASYFEADPFEGLHTETTLNYFAPTCNGSSSIEDPTSVPESCVSSVDRDGKSMATGSYSASNAQVRWASCDAPPEYSNHAFYSPEHSATGEGCLSDMRVQGNILCEGPSCSTASMQEGDNVVDASWNQPLENLQLSKNGMSVSLNEQRVPSHLDSNIYVSFTTKSASIDCK